jgi:hypothetical protein
MPWDLQLIEGGRVGQNPAIIDFDGNPAIIYAGVGNQSIRFARQIAGTWTSTDIRASKRGNIGSLDAEDTQITRTVIAFIDRPANPVATSVSDVVYGTLNGTKWNFEIVDSDSFSQRFFYNVKIKVIPESTFIGWVQRAPGGAFELVIAQPTVKDWFVFKPGISGISTTWDLSRIGNSLAAAYFDNRNREIRYIVRGAGNAGWSQPETVAKFSGSQSIVGISLVDILGQPHLSYQVNFGVGANPGSQRHATKVDGIWTEDFIQQQFATSGLVDKATYMDHFGIPAVAYHGRVRDTIYYAVFITPDPYDPYGLPMWIVDEVGQDMIQPSLIHIGTTPYIATFHIKLQGVIFAEETLNG